MKPGPVIAQQLGPMGINMGQVISKVNEATKEFKGLAVIWLALFRCGTQCSSI